MNQPPERQPARCTFPLGDPKAETFCLCRRPAAPGSRYCEEHRTVAVKPETVAERNRFMAHALRWANR